MEERDSWWIHTSPAWFLWMGAGAKCSHSNLGENRHPYCEWNINLTNLPHPSLPRTQGSLSIIHLHVEYSHILLCTYLYSTQIPWLLSSCRKLVAYHIQTVSILLLPYVYSFNRFVLHFVSPELQWTAAFDDWKILSLSVLYWWGWLCCIRTHVCLIYRTYSIVHVAQVYSSAYIKRKLW